MSIFEVIMLLAFGAAWPASIYKSWTSKSTKGKSVHFLYILVVGYIAGIVNKVVYFPEDMIVYLYVLNMCMVTVDIVLFYRNRRYEKKMEALGYKCDF